MDIGNRDQAIVIARHNGMTYAAIARAHGLTRSRVEQIVSKAQRAAKPRTPVHELSTRVRNAIQAEGCEVTPADVARRLKHTDLKRVPNLGVKGIAELNAWLIRHGQKPIAEKRKRTWPA